MEERTSDGRFSDSFLKEFFDTQSDVKRLKEHEANDSKKYERWHDEITQRLAELEKMRGELALTAVHNLTAEEARDALRARLDELVNGKLGALDDRQRAMERTLWRASGAATVIISIVIIVVNVVIKHF
jgi:hypothetical protein